MDVEFSTHAAQLRHSDEQNGCFFHADADPAFDDIVNGHSRILNWRYLPYIRPIC